MSLPGKNFCREHVLSPAEVALLYVGVNIYIFVLDPLTLVFIRVTRRGLEFLPICSGSGHFGPTFVNILFTYLKVISVALLRRVLMIIVGRFFVVDFVNC